MEFRVATWNVQWATPASRRSVEILKRLHGIAPDIVCLTESDNKLLSRDGHTVCSQPDYGYPLRVGRRKVLLWSKEPWREVDDLVMDSLLPGRFVSGITRTPIREIAVIGICIPWSGSRAEARRRMERKKRWVDYESFLDGLLGQRKQPYFGHYRQTTSCEGWLHATAKLLLLERQQDAIASQTGVPIKWSCSDCCCFHDGNLVKRDVHRRARAPPRPGRSICQTRPGCLRRRPQHGQHPGSSRHSRPENTVHQLAVDSAVPLLIFNVSEADLPYWRGDRPYTFTPKVHNAPCPCQRDRCPQCGERPCESYHPHPHRTCGLCQKCVSDNHRHCNCGALISHTNYRQCFCCWIGCKDRIQEHRHCKTRDCRKAIYNKDRYGLLYEQCYTCLQTERAKIQEQIERQQAKSAKKQAIPHIKPEPRQTARNDRLDQEWEEFRTWFHQRQLR